MINVMKNAPIPPKKLKHNKKAKYYENESIEKGRNLIWKKS